MFFITDHYKIKAVKMSQVYTGVIIAYIRGINNLDWTYNNILRISYNNKLICIEPHSK